MGDRTAGTAAARRHPHERTQRHHHRGTPAQVVDHSPASWPAAPDQSVEYRHIGPLGVTRIAGGSFAAAAGLICLAYRVYGWAAFFLLLGALNLAGGYWYLTIARSRSARA